MNEFGRQVGIKAARKLNARADKVAVIPFGLGMMGLIGWSVTVPALLGTALGMWMDRRHPGPHSWTLALLVVGLALGCWSAWRWVARELTHIPDPDRDPQN